MKYTIRDLQTDFPDEDSCLEWLVNFKYPDGITCPTCQKVTKHYKLANRKCYSCSVCRHQVHPTAGTILHKSRTPLVLWFYVIFVMSNTKSGVSAAQLQRELGVRYKTAWRMMHQVRKMMDSPNGVFSDEVEMDETFIHPNPYKRSSAMSMYTSDARRSGQVLFGIVQRGGAVRVWHVKSAGARVLLPIIEKNVKYGTIIHTDGYGAYRTLPRRGYNHKWTNHSIFEFYTEDSSTQNIENFWSHLKRGLKGVYRHVSSEYLQAYANEYAWRYSHRSSVSMFWALMGRVAEPSPDSYKTVS